MILAVLLAGGLGVVVFIVVKEHLEIPPAEAARTAVTLIGVPTAAGAVFVALRSLRLKEQQLHADQQRVVDAYRTYALAFDTEHSRRQYDQERELRARYVSAAEQIGHDSAAVRLAGVNAMAHLATDWTEQRQSCVDVLCAYLRLPHLKMTSSNTADADIDDPADGEVRRTVQRLIAEGFKKDAEGKPSWPDTDLDLDRAELNDFIMEDAVIRRASFKRTVFRGPTMFHGGSSNNVSFQRAVFLGRTSFARTVFGKSDFSGAAFHDYVRFDIFYEERPGFIYNSFMDTMHVSARADRNYNFRRASFAVEPTKGKWVSYEACRLNGLPYEPPSTSDGAFKNNQA
ncbi:pentapeptide repeat-containing protein [Pseudarthrobacter siccitolerans]|uniref:pentapeptide repeat-containing protein n=1 Tax=Pseudarthrobacter siccitolerans TaxID=861266 RepID=UPI0027B8AD31|nr:pentapeptide repeat-containing protein [Pseudarthrobacter siccitolerans]